MVNRYKCYNFKLFNFNYKLNLNFRFSIDTLCCGHLLRIINCAKNKMQSLDMRASKGVHFCLKIEL